MTTPLELTKSLRDISVTERSSFRNCRRQWYLEVIENLEPKEPTWALTFGTGMHEALEAYYVSQLEGASNHALANAEDAFVEWWERTEVKTKKELGSYCTPEVLDELMGLKDLGLGMLTNYERFEATKGERWEILAVEGHNIEQAFGKHAAPEGYRKASRVLLHESGRFLVPIVHPRTRVRLPGTPYLTARIDLLVNRASPNKGLWVVDHKNVTQAPNDRGLDFDDQVTGYCYVVYRLTGVMPRGVIYNNLIKQLPKEPRLVNEGTKLSTAKDQLCLADDYREALKEHGLMDGKGRVESDKHAECLDSLLARGFKPFFRRFEPTRNEQEILNFEERLYEEYLDMRQAHKHPQKRYPNPNTMQCGWCDMASICQAMEDGSDYEHIIETRYQEGEDRKAVRN